MLECCRVREGGGGGKSSLPALGTLPDVGLLGSGKCVLQIPRLSSFRFLPRFFFDGLLLRRLCITSTQSWSSLQIVPKLDLVALRAAQDLDLYFA